jgi:hypothetical protein
MFQDVPPPPPPRAIGRVLTRVSASSVPPAGDPMIEPPFVMAPRWKLDPVVTVMPPTDTDELDSLRSKVAALEAELAHLRFQALTQAPAEPAPKPASLPPVAATPKPTPPPPTRYRAVDAAGQAFEHHNKEELEAYIRQRNASMYYPPAPQWPQPR